MKINPRNLALLSLLGLGLATRLAAGDLAPRAGLLGTSYAGASYVWHNFADVSINGQGFALEANWPVRANLDFTLNYDRWETDEILGVKGRQQMILAGLRIFTTEQDTRYYCSVDAGWAQAEVSGFMSDDVLTYRFGAGAEFAVNSALSLTPFAHVEFYDSGGNSLVYGLKANAWVHRNWGLSAAIMRNDDSDMSYQLGVRVRF